MKRWLVVLAILGGAFIGLMGALWLSNLGPGPTSMEVMPR